MRTMAFQAPSVWPSVSTAEEPTGHRNVETGTGEPTGRRDPGIGNGPLDERIFRPMAGRPAPGRDIADQLGREPEPIQVPNVILGREGRPHIPLFREKTEEKELDRGDISARLPGHFRTGAPDNSAPVPPDNCQGLIENARLRAFRELCRGICCWSW